MAKKKTTKKTTKKQTHRRNRTRVHQPDVLDDPATPGMTDVTPYPQLGEADDFQRLVDEQTRPAGRTSEGSRASKEAARPGTADAASVQYDQALSYEMIAAMWKRPFDLWSVAANNRAYGLNDAEARELAEPTKIILDSSGAKFNPVKLAWYNIFISASALIGSRLMLARQIAKNKKSGPAGKTPVTHTEARNDWQPKEV